MIRSIFDWHEEFPFHQSKLAIKCIHSMMLQWEPCQYGNPTQRTIYGKWPMVKKVMIVEDNELNMKLFRDLIEASGYETIRTRNGLEALDLAREHRPDLILMDIQLPEVSGLEVTKWLKADDDLHVI
ncbi:MAG: response regulator, partial [Pyrinomonadaceae bacterium]